jgi:hypothetical protein
LFFVGLPPSPLGAVTRKISKNQWTGAKRWIHKCSGGEEQIRCRHGDGFQPNHHSQLYAEKNKMKIFKGLSKCKNMVFNVKKLHNDGVDLMLQQRDRKK